MKKLLISLLLLCCTAALAGPARPVTSGSFSAQALCGPAWDPTALQGQWFADPASGATNVNAWEYCDDTNSFTIAGIATNISYSTPGNTNSNIIAFDIVATVRNNLPVEYDYVLNATNSHGEILQQSAGVGTHTMKDTRITAEFAIADTSMIPAGSPPYWPDPVSGGSYHIEAVNEDLRAWYCWDPKSGQLPAGQFQVPAWNLVPSTIPPGGSAQVTMSFQVTGSGLPLSDYRHSVIRASFANGWDVLYNRHPSLKISHWLDTLLIDNGYSFCSTPSQPWWEGEPVEHIYASNASVFFNIEKNEYPHKMHWPQLPDPNGWDVRACFSEEDGKQKVLADDFLCTASGPITNITFWGSWFFDEFIIDDPFQGITNIHLSIHDDIPAGEVAQYSMPNLPALKEWNIDPHRLPANWNVVITPEEPSMQGWYDPNTGMVAPSNHMQYFRYDITIPEEDAFVQVSNTIYWLDISMSIAEGPEGEIYLWGWKTTTNHWNDDAVYADMPVTDLTQWNELYEPPKFTNSLDLAFLIDGPPEQPPEEKIDWGDAPDSVQTPQYPTLAANNGANHTIVPGAPYFDDGTQTDQPDPESDGQPTANADGDDLNGASPDDENGINIPTLYAGQSGSVTITVDDGAGGAGAGGGYVDAWIDFNGDGSWATPGEQIVSGWLPQGPNIVKFSVPAGSVIGQTFGRFRINSLAAGLPPTGNAPDGEVEDHKVTISQAEENLDWGDAPDSLTAPPGFNTLAVNNGANHTIVPGIFMGTLIDPELDGQPNPTATGDDIDAAGNDEDGVMAPFPPLIPGQPATFTVVVSAPGWLDVWLDVDASGTWTGPDYVFSGPVSTGPNPVLITPPYNSTPGASYMRFRYNTGGPLPPVGWAANGEVEDYLVNIEEPELDWGDAPDTYKTLSASGGPRHIIATGVQLGATIDAESDGQPTADASGDGADEDGISFAGKLIAGANAVIKVTAGSAGGSLDGWIDYNGNSVFDDPSEHLFGGSSAVLTSSPTNLSFTVPSQPTLGPSYARFRLSTAGGLPPDNSGLTSIPDGEVEDYTVDIYQPAPTNLVITNIVVTLSNSLAKIEWTAQPNITYQAQSTTNLTVSNSWTDVGGWIIQNWQTNSAAPTQQFYRVSAPWTP